MATINFDVFGRRVLVTRKGDAWSAFYPGADGKRRPAPDIVIPPDVGEDALERFLDDLCHEWATARNPRVTRLD